MKDRILIVDDDPVQRRILNAAVTRLGYEAVEAEGGDEALAALGGPDAEQIALVVLDLVMPDLDGMGVLAGMARAGIRKVAAVSCNPVTLARDLEILIAGGYRLLSVTPYDQFLFTAHVEAVALLEKPVRRR